MNVGTLTALLTLDKSQYDKGLDSAERQANEAGSRIGGAFDKAKGLILPVAAGAIAVGAAIGKAAYEGLSFNNAMEQARAKLNAFNKDANKTNQELDWINEEAAKTPFEFQEMVNAFAALKPAAKGANLDMKDLIKTVEVLAASNPAQGMEGAAYAMREALGGDFTSFIERFDMPRQLIKDLKDQGLPNIEIVRKALAYMGYDMDLVTQMANTLTGRWSTFTDTLKTTAGIITQPLFDALSSGLGKVNDYLDANKPLITAFANTMAGYVKGAIDSTVASINMLIGAWIKFSSIFENGLSVATINLIWKLLPPQIAAQVSQGFLDIRASYIAFMEILGRGNDILTTAINLLYKFLPPQVAATIADGIIGIKDAVMQAFSEGGILGVIDLALTEIGKFSPTVNLLYTIAKDIFPSVQQFVTDAFATIQYVFENAQTYIQPVVDLIVNNMDAIKGAFQAVGLLFAGETFISILVAGSALVAGALGGIVTGLMALLSPINLVIAAVALLGAAYNSNFMGFKDTVDNVVNSVVTTLPQIPAIINTVLTQGKDLFNTFVKTVVDTFVTFKTNLINNNQETINGLMMIWTEIQKFISGIANIITILVSTAFTVMQKFIQQNGGDIQDFLSKTWDKIYNIIGDALTLIGGVVLVTMQFLNATIIPAFTIIANFIAAHSDQIVQVLTGAWNIIKGVINIALGIIQGVLKTVLAAVQGDWAGAWKAIKTMFSDVWDGIKSILTGALQIITATLSTAWDIIKAAAIAAWNALLEDIQNKWNNFVKSAEQFGKMVLEGFITGVLGMSGAAADAIVNVVSDALQSAKEYLGIHSPSRVANETLGQPLVQGIIEGVTGGAGELMGALNGILDNALSAAQAAVREIKSLADVGINLGSKTVEGAFKGGLNLNRFASGTNFAPGGLALVGEKGPELVNLPRGSKVFSANETAAMNTTNIYNLNYTTQQSSGSVANDIGMLQAMKKGV